MYIYLYMKASGERLAAAAAAATGGSICELPLLFSVQHQHCIAMREASNDRHYYY